MSEQATLTSGASLELAATNVVLAAKNFNPSIITQLWLVDNGIVHREEFKNGCIFTEMMSNVVSDPLALLVTPEQIQFVPRVAPDQERDLIMDRLGRFVRILPHTPYSAVGLNFTWHLKPDDRGIRALSRELCFQPSNPLFQTFDTEDAKFGSYLSMNFMGSRLRLDVKPILLRRPDAELDLMQYSFNLNLDVATSRNSPDLICELFGMWDLTKQKTADIMQTVTGSLA